MFRYRRKSEVPENPFRAEAHEGRGTVHRIRGLRVFAVPLHNRNRYYTKENGNVIGNRLRVRGGATRHTH